MEQFNYQSFLTYIVLAFIVAITIHLLFKIFYKNVLPKSNETMKNQNSLYNIQSNVPNTFYVKNMDYSASDNVMQPKTIDNSDPYQIVKNVNNAHKASKSNNSDINNEEIIRSIHGVNKQYRDYDTASYDANELDESNGDSTDEIAGLGKNWNTMDCIDCEYDNTYTREFMLNNDLPPPTQPRNYTEDEMQDYRDGFFNFRNKTYQSSHGVDSAEILNENILANNGEVYDVNEKAKKGERISDIYDAMTVGQYKNTNNMIAPSYDRITLTPQFKMNGGNGAFLTNDNWMYKTDKVMNGGEFLDGITGSDSYRDNNMAISY